MHIPKSPLGHAVRVSAILGVASLVLAFEATAQTNAPPPRKQVDGEKRLEVWREAMTQTPRPKKGCFKSTYPKLEWQEIACKTPPPFPMPPRRGPLPYTVGAGHNASAEVPVVSSFISKAIGTFDSVIGVTSISSPIANTGSPVNNAYTLQINTDFFESTACAGSPNPNCKGWQQFVFANNGSWGFTWIQYWLIKYNANCPGGWNQFSFTGEQEIYCYRNNSAGSASVLNQPITNLGQLTLTGTVSTSGDSVIFSTGGNTYSVEGDNSVNAAAGWRIAEFGVFGYGGNSDGGGEATFNNGSRIVPRTRIFYGGTAAPICVAEGFTGETNNLWFGPAAPVATAPGPAVLSTQSSLGLWQTDCPVPSVSPTNCASATTVGDTHLTTFGGLLYDFQASGDFVLAQTDLDFVVQARQVSAAPTWPNASVNSAVAMQMGKTRVAICLAPKRQLVIDGKTVSLKDGERIALPDGVNLLRRCNTIFIRGQRGDSVRAVLHKDWIDVSVGLGRWPVKVRGLLFNTERFGIETRDGTELRSPISFRDLYRKYGDSWRVPLKRSLLSICGDGKVEQRNPEKAFYARDLDRDLFRRARAICAQAGVTEQSLLDACTLDVSVIGTGTAAKVFAKCPRQSLFWNPRLESGCFHKRALIRETLL